jgi:hypothetical protein
MNFKLFPGLYYERKHRGVHMRLFSHYAYHALGEFYTGDTVFEPGYTIPMAVKGHFGQCMAGTLDSNQSIRTTTVVKRKIGSQVFDCTVPEVSFKMFNTFCVYFQMNFHLILDDIGESYSNFSSGTLSPEFWRKFVSEYDASVILYLLEKYSVEEDLTLPGIPLIAFHGTRTLKEDVVLKPEMFYGLTSSSVSLLVKSLPMDSVLIKEFPSVCSGCLNMKAVIPEVYSTGPPHLMNFYSWIEILTNDHSVMVVIWSKTKKVAQKLLRLLSTLDLECDACSRPRGWDSFCARFMPYLTFYSYEECGVAWKSREFLTKLLRDHPKYSELVPMLPIYLSSEKDFNKAHHLGDGELVMSLRKMNIPSKSSHMLQVLLEPNKMMSDFISDHLNLGEKKISEIFGDRNEVHARGTLFELLYYLASEVSDEVLTYLMDEYFYWFLLQVQKSMRVRNDAMITEEIVDRVREVLSGARKPMKAIDIKKELQCCGIEIEKSVVNRVLHTRFADCSFGRGLWKFDL